MENNSNININISNTTQHRFNRNGCVHGNNDGTADLYFTSLPVGWRFRPTDAELITHYLRPKLDGKPLPKNQIHEVNLYDFTPEELSERYRRGGEPTMYFFTSTVKKYPNGSRPNRSAGTGHWKASGADQPIKTKGRKIGAKRTLVFYKSPPKVHEEKTNWIMYEYKVPHDILPPTKTVESDSNELDKWVLCKIYERKRKDNPKEVSKSQKLSASSSSKDMALDSANLSDPSPHLADDLPPFPDTIDFQTEVIADPINPNHPFSMADNLSQLLMRPLQPTELSMMLMPNSTSQMAAQTSVFSEFDNDQNAPPLADSLLSFDGLDFNLPFLPHLFNSDAPSDFP